MPVANNVRFLLFENLDARTELLVDAHRRLNQLEVSLKKQKVGSRCVPREERNATRDAVVVSITHDAHLKGEGSREVCACGVVVVGVFGGLALFRGISLRTAPVPRPLPHGVC
jgi:hypothetical protein